MLEALGELPSPFLPLPLVLALAFPLGKQLRYVLAVGIGDTQGCGLAIDYRIDHGCNPNRVYQPIGRVEASTAIAASTAGKEQSAMGPWCIHSGEVRECLLNADLRIQPWEARHHHQPRS